MKKGTQLLLFSLFLTSSVMLGQTLAERQQISGNYDLDKLAQIAEKYETRFTSEKQKALDLAAVHGWQEVIQMPNGGLGILVGVYENGNPKYLVTHNREGAITTRANKINSGGGAGLDLNGENMIAGIWEVGDARLTHPLLENRVTQMDNPSQISDHATHVSGTILGSATPNGGATKGMAPMAEGHSYTSSNSFGEMANAAADGLLISNHSYGANINSVPLWRIGYYDSSAAAVDNVCYNAPYYLPVYSAGNDRQSGQNSGDGGYDYLTDSGTNKNAITSAAVVEVLNYTGPSSVIMSSFSSWGPTDDGRIKPDVAAKGVNMFSSIGTTTYANFSGTSMSAPNTAGSLLLLQQHYNDLNGQFMLSSTLRGLALHTADEAGNNPGPDYRFGWGLLNVERGAEVISNEGTNSVIIEGEILSGEVYTMTVQSDNVNDLVASLTWTDPAGRLLPTGVEDDSTPSLVHDLDLRVSKDGGATFLPWKLDVANFSAPATNGDNIVDNIEKTEISGASGEYIIRVSNKGSFITNSQTFSLIVTGIDREDFYVSSYDGIVKSCEGDTSASFEIDLGFSDGFTDTIDFTVSGVPGGATGTIVPASMNTEGTAVLTVDNIGALAVGDYTMTVTATGTSETVSLYLILTVTDDFNIPQIGLIYPTHNLLLAPTTIDLTWGLGNIEIDEYEFQLASDVDFTDILVSEILTGTTTTVSGLELNTWHYWRVRGLSDCGDGDFSEVFAFKTTNVVGLDENTIEGLVLYPNPTNNVLNVEAKVAISSIEVMNMLGQTVLTKSSTSNKTQVDISALSTGSYFVRVTSENNSSVLQVLKQ